MEVTVQSCIVWSEGFVSKVGAVLVTVTLKIFPSVVRRESVTLTLKL